VRGVCSDATVPFALLEQIRLVEVEREDATKTTIAWIAAGTAIALAAAVIFAAEACQDGASFYC
jgi:hypothetical protein